MFTLEYEFSWNEFRDIDLEILFQKSEHMLVVRETFMGEFVVRMTAFITERVRAL